MVKRKLGGAKSGQSGAEAKPSQLAGGENRNSDTGLINMTGVAVANLSKSQEEGKRKSYARLDPDVVVRLANPRVVYCGYDEIRRTAWPSLDTPADQVEPKLRAVLDSQDWYRKLSTVERPRAYEFFLGIHELACSMYQNSQLQPIVLERDDPTLMEGRLLAGERRLMAVLYSQGWITSISAEIYNQRLSELERAVIRDQENAKSSLSVYEIIRSKEAVYRHLPSAKDIPLDKLAGVLGYRTTSTASILRRLFALKNYEEVMRVVWLESSGWRRVDELLKIATERPDAITALLAKLDAVKDVPGKPDAAGKRRKTAPGGDTKRRLKKIGLNVGKGTDIKVPGKVVELALGSQEMPQAARDEIRKLDLSTVEGLENAWLILADTFAEGGSNG